MIDNIYLFGQEHFHTWLGQKVAPNYSKQGSEYMKWFIEGFTDYYANYLNYKANLISLEEYVELYNSVLQEYFLSNYQNISNTELCTSSKTYDKERINYLRGNIFAQELNNKININSRDNLNPVLRTIVKDCIKSSCSLNLT